MNLLLDTHTFLWWAHDPARLSRTAYAALYDLQHTLYLSVASIWEIQIKIQIGKLILPKPLAHVVENQQHINNLQLLTIAPAHIYQLDTLPLHHKDPFDRMILAQAFAENCTIVSVDGVFSQYGAPVLWE